ncbi:MAG TPA: hypothetical protein VEB19_05875 [Gemmatimonadaceae bacterium]|nr:hypothetical protein [Gemmatimonadaceae bacterium]
MTKVLAYSDAAQRGRSRFFIAIALIALASATHAGMIQAQSPRDSLAERLRRAEAAIAALEMQIAEQAQSAVTTRSRARMELNGRILMNAFSNSRRVNNVDNPQFVQPDPVPAVPMRGLGLAIRQSRLGLAVTVPEALNGTFTGDVDVDFYGGQVPSGGGRTFPLLRLRTARGILRWTHADVMVGQESPLISDVDPMTVGAVGSPAFAAAGNLWLWLPQIRAGAEITRGLRWGTQVAVLAPTSGDPAAFFDTDNDLAERSARPFLQGRVSAGWGDDHPGEVGCGVHRGWLMPLAEREESKAIACDLRVAVHGWLDVRGEYFTGQALRGLGGGGIGQNFTPANEPLQSTGGWAQVNVMPRPGLSAGIGCGTDQPDGSVARRRNDVCAGYAMLRPPGPMFVGIEYRRLSTLYSTGWLRNDHVTLGTGFEF